jgi:hypothetical protein
MIFSLQLFRLKYCYYFSSSIRTTRLTHLILLDIINFTAFNEDCNSWSFLLRCFLQSPVLSSLWTNSMERSYSWKLRATELVRNLPHSTRPRVCFGAAGRTPQLTSAFIQTNPVISSQPVSSTSILILFPHSSLQFFRCALPFKHGNSLSLGSEYPYRPQVPKSPQFVLLPAVWWIKFHTRIK